MRRCFSSLGCAELSLEQTFALAVRHDVPLVELRALNGTVDLAATFAAAYGSPDGLAGWLRANETPVAIVAFNASLKLVGGSAAERTQLEGLAPWADAAGVRWLRVFDGGKTADEVEFAAAEETLRWWRDLRKARGWRVDLMVETHDALFTAAAISRFVTRLPGTAILWDAHHTWRKGGEDPLVTWAGVRRHVVHVHVKDSIAVPSARHPFTYVLPGDGDFPCAPLLAAMAADRFAGAVSLEWERLWHPYLPPLEEALRVAAERQWW